MKIFILFGVNVKRTIEFIRLIVQIQKCSGAVLSETFGEDKLLICVFGQMHSYFTQHKNHSEFVRHEGPSNGTLDYCLKRS